MAKAIKLILRATCVLKIQTTIENWERKFFNCIQVRKHLEWRKKGY